MQISDRLKAIICFAIAAFLFIAPMLFQISVGTHLFGAVAVLVFLFGMMFVLRKPKA